MKLTIAQAIRIGAAKHPQGDGERHGLNNESCVLGAIEDAFGVDSYVVDSYVVGCCYSAESLFPVLNIDVTSPQTGRFGALAAVMADLNNGNSYYVSDRQSHKFEPWSREKIADWIDTLPEINAVVATS